MGKLNLVLEVYDALCATKIFSINGIEADHDDFGEHEDTDTEYAEEYGCGNMEFIRKPSTSAILAKYRITEDDYQHICDELTDKLSFGACGWCV